MSVWAYDEPYPTDPKARAIVDQLARIDLRNPRIDRNVVDQAIPRHLDELGHPPRPCRWFASAAAALERVLELVAIGPADSPLCTGIYDGCARREVHDVELELSRATEQEAAARAWYAAWVRSGIQEVDRMADKRVMLPAAGDRFSFSAIAGAARCAHGIQDLALYLAAKSSSPAPELTKAVEIWRPMVDAAEAGLFRYWITCREVICVPRPSLFVVSHRLHREDGPAVEWPSGERHWFWHGVEVPDWLIEHPRRITPDRIRNERNIELRRCMIERFGAERLVRELGGELVGHDHYGRLWHSRVAQDAVYAIVEVENGTPEPDGSRRRYFLSVPPAVQTARDAVAWTYGMNAEEYRVAVRT